jgi:hypothetical protein
VVLALLGNPRHTFCIGRVATNPPSPKFEN